ncbi:hypothetical protein CAEBREN_07813 [Caenorhabditis brenneri]|uniref:Sdz-33 F-box domain-containing protein n=1 Tax=Caenorhabditis brenneri TaxID=135651 RepID=G0MBP2_CAEBE|nr:hypothetical protein CAEBREN_07813 [Caenorhabditis brenneri]
MIPLLRLPKRALDIVLRNLTTMNQYLLAIYDDCFKSEIKSLTIGIDFTFKIIVSDVFFMYIVGPDDAWSYLDIIIYNNESGSVARKEGEPKRSFTENDRISVMYRDYDWDYGWSYNPQGNARQWILLIMEVFNLKKIDNLHYGMDNWCFDSVKEMLKGIPLETLEISEEEPLRNYEQILKTVPPCSHFVQETNPGEKFRRVLIQNFESMRVSLLNFSELFIINSKFLSISERKFTIKNMNTFLKLWRKGSNPNAKHFSIRSIPIPANDDVMNILKGIPYETIPDAVERSFLKFIYSPPVKYEKIQGGYDIKRMTDGRKATVKLERRWESNLYFDFFVWDE